VYAATNNGGPYKLTGTNISGLILTNTGLTNGVLYYYHVTATNAFGVSDVSMPASARPTSSGVPHLNSSLGSGQFTLGWPVDHTGWRLLMQTNSLAQGLGTNWMTVAGSTNFDLMNLPFSNAYGSVFFRLVYP
jgi:hypothetical protein